MKAIIYFILTLITQAVHAQVFSYLDVQGPLYTRENIYTLNKAGNGWIAWATRNSSLSETKIDLSNINNATLSGSLGIGGGNLSIYGSGLDGSTYQKTVIYSDVTNGLYFDAPKTSSGSKLDIQFNWRGGGTPPLFVQGSTSNVGIGTLSPSGKLHLVGNGSNLNVGNSSVISGDLVVQANTGGRNTSAGASLEFVIPANTDGSNLWGQGRIITVAGNTNSGNASGKMILGTRRYWQKPGTSAAEWFYGDDLTIDGVGNVGIGTNSPSSKLTVYDAGNTTGTGIVIGNTGTGFTSLLMGTHGASNSYAYIGSIKNSGSSYGDLIINENGGNVGIGNNSPDAKLAVSGQVHAQEVKVSITVPGPDYVFEKDYKLTSLEDIKTYIDQNKHLPEVPSAKEMEKNGVQLGEMNMLLLKKIEELTLHVIAQNNMIEAMKEKHQKEINEIKLQISKK